MRAIMARIELAARLKVGDPEGIRQAAHALRRAGPGAAVWLTTATW